MLGPAATPETLTGDAREPVTGLFSGLIFPLTGEKSFASTPLLLVELPELGTESFIEGESRLDSPELLPASFARVSMEWLRTWLDSCARKDWDLRWFWAFAGCNESDDFFECPLPLLPLLEDAEDAEDDTGSLDADGDTTRCWLDMGDIDFCRSTLASASAWSWLAPAPAPAPDPDPDPGPVSVFDRDRILDDGVFLYVGVDDVPAMVDSVCGLCGGEENGVRRLWINCPAETRRVQRGTRHTARGAARGSTPLRGTVLPEKGPDQGPERAEIRAGPGASSSDHRCRQIASVRASQTIESLQRPPRGECETGGGAK